MNQMNLKIMMMMLWIQIITQKKTPRKMIVTVATQEMTLVNAPHSEKWAKNKI